MAKFICWRTNMRVSFETIVKSHKTLFMCIKVFVK